MILTDLQTYLSQRGQVSLAEIKLHFRIEANALRAMLQRLIRKGRVKKLSMTDRCHHCDSCSEESLEVYEWVSATPTETVSPASCGCAKK